MKKTLSLAVMVMAMGAGSAMAADVPVAAGQITFNGQVDPATCIAKVVDGGKTSIGSDGTVTLKTVTLADMKAAATVAQNTTGLNPKDFSITVDCTGADADLKNVALYMSSADFANSDGTLANNTNITLGSGIKMANGVSIAVHEVEAAGGLTLVNMVNHSDKHELALDDTTRAGTYNLRASYVMAPGVTSDAVTSGAVTTNSIYSIVYN
ncbi:fimbrial protein [Salmonella enterica subsp. enterica serovar Derby]|uniref:Fimbrial protein n=14 Tax=Salmonella enterica TaxID=28901 RepID=A0A2T8LZL0_SALAN|nr:MULTISPECIES: fimbrial protein [Salmonella]AZT35442.1 pilus assembly protein [Salmonella enterica subsp. enterica serovar Karamoja]EAA2006357.1 pilus assembly protein [Salmonella enterica subsp. enterica serovar Newington]EAA2344750.1 pilus assembly protein [Salmonella enterica subsp. enterica serovar Montevideo]EAA2727429.1 pilus assembly protein [Salmonella enterica subsp. enterica serovar Idikan]EAA2975855.1 pilus assembly protein [Salmonella enterica subsp. enterica serovar Mbao]EAA364